MELKEITIKIEKISAIYASKFSIQRDDDWYILKLQEELGELTQRYLMMKGKARKKDLSDDQIMAAFEGEVADVFCQVILLAKHNKIDLPDAVEKKWLKWL